MDDRGEFLIRMYEKCWENVTRAEDALWKILAAYTAVFAGLAIAEDMIGFYGFALLVTVFSLVGMFTAINANSWFVRNIGLIANLEKEFLNNNDFDAIIPKRWVTNKVTFINREIWWIMFFLFPAIIITSMFVLYTQLLDDQKLHVTLLVSAGFVIVFIYFFKTRSSHLKFLDEAKGKQIT